MILIILERILGKLEVESSDTQTAYRKNLGCSDLLTALQILIEKLNDTYHKACLLFIDNSKTFDSTSHKQLFSIMLKMGFSPSLLQILYTDHSVLSDGMSSGFYPLPLRKE